VSDTENTNDNKQMSIFKEVIDFTNYADVCHMNKVAGVKRASAGEIFAHLKRLAPYEHVEMEEDDAGRSVRVQCVKRPDGKTDMYTISGKPDDVSVMYHALREMSEGAERISYFTPRRNA
jgi:hypothetical protein